jgi:hypothetical protein
MQTTTILVDAVSQPKPGGKMGSVKAAHGGPWYRVWADKLPLYIAGQTYDIDFDTTEWQGKPQLTIKNTPRPKSGVSPPSPAKGNGAAPPHNYKDLDIATQAVAKVFGPLIVAREVEGEISPEAIAEIMTRCEAGVKRWWRSRSVVAPPAPPPPPPPRNDPVEDIEDTF